MKKIPIFVVLSLWFCIVGCSLPSVAVRGQLNSYTREEKRTKGIFGTKKEILVKDFRGSDAYEEDIDAFKQEIEKYISGHPNLSESTKSNLRELKVAQGASKEEVALLLGKPDKVVNRRGRSKYGASQVWIYKIDKIRAFTVFIIPVFFVHEGYYLYFADDILAGIEMHYLQQLIQQSPGPGVFQRQEKTPE